MVLVIPSYAGYISLTSSLSSEVTPPLIKARLSLKNNGDEAAYSIQAEFLAGDKRWLSGMIPKIDVDQTLEIEYVEEIQSAKTGVYPLIAKIHFKDAGGYPMMAVVVNPYTYKEATRSQIFGILEDLSLAKNGALNLQMTNRGYDDLSLDVNIYTPDELSVKPARSQFLLGSRSKRDEKFKLGNFSALTGAVYPVWAVIEYEAMDQHFTHICSARVEIVASVSFFQKYWRLCLGLAAFMIFVFIWINLKKRRSQNKFKQE